MAEAFVWGAVGAGALLVGALVAYLLAPRSSVIAVVMALGTGLLIGSVSFELIDEALKTRTVAWVALLVLVGALAFTLGDWLLSRQGGGGRKDPDGAQAEGSPLAIVLGSVLDGIPESFVLGLTVLQGGVSVSLLAGVALSNLPEGMSSSSGLKAAGWPRSRVVLMWLAVVAVSALSAAAPARWSRRSPRGRCWRCWPTRCCPRPTRSRASSPGRWWWWGSRPRWRCPRSEPAAGAVVPRAAEVTRRRIGEPRPRPRRGGKVGARRGRDR
jgi:zinc transporter, ZIP family